MKRISVIVPVYKVEPYLRRCVDSILGQSYQDFELILVDDGSPDNCGAICDEYAQKDSRIHVIHQENGGLSAARNAGIDWAFANSDSQWLIFIDSDDWLHRDNLAVLYQSAEKLNAEISICDDYILSENWCEDKPLGAFEMFSISAEQAYVHHYNRCMAARGKLYAKHLFRDIRFPLGKLHEDAFITHILMFQAGSVAIVPEPLYYYYQSSQSITRSHWTEKRLDGLQAHEQRLEYFREMGNDACYGKELEETAGFLMNNLRILMELYDTDEFYRMHFDAIRSKLQRYFREGRQLGLLRPDRENVWAWIFAAPSAVVWKTAYALWKLYKKIR